ncbi:S-methyl-5-thioribose-1-phosphate isomerase [soil metagenome]
MNIDGVPYRTVWPSAELDSVHVIDQRELPHRLRTLSLNNVGAVHAAIRDMAVRGAPLIGATAAYGMALQAADDAGDSALMAAAGHLESARPTAVNLRWAVQRMLQSLLAAPLDDRRAHAWREAAALAQADVDANAALGRFGCEVLKRLALELGRPPGQPLNVLTHCNAGWLATVDRGTALSPIYEARDAGLLLHVWVEETRPRNQGASLTAWELLHENIPHTVIADNAGGHVMQHGLVDVVIVGCDRVSANGDVCNKIGTYLKALAAHDNHVPFYVAMPTSTLDLTLADGLREIPIEQRSPREVTHITGLAASGETVEVQLTPTGSAASNPGFDVTPHRLVTGLITERGVVSADAAALRQLADSAP